MERKTAAPTQIDAPSVFKDEDDNEYHGDEARARFDAHLAEVQEHNERALAQLKPHELAKLEAWLRTRTRSTPPRRPGSRVGTGRAPRPGTNARSRGSKRSSTRRSSERSGDSGSQDSEPEPPTCQYSQCGRSLENLRKGAKHCCAKHRVYAQRERDRANPERVAERDSQNGKAHFAGCCTCEPAHNLFDGESCCKCGHNGWPACAHARGIPAKGPVIARPVGLKARSPRLGDGKRRPVELKAVPA